MLKAPPQFDPDAASGQLSTSASEAVLALPNNGLGKKAQFYAISVSQSTYVRIKLGNSASVSINSPANTEHFSMTRDGSPYIINAAGMTHLAAIATSGGALVATPLANQ